MALQTGENEQALRKIIDLTRWIAIASLLLHFYEIGYAVFKQAKWQHDFLDRILLNIRATGLFNRSLTAKLLALAFLLISLLGARGRKSEKLSLRKAIWTMSVGLGGYFLSELSWLAAASFATRFYAYVLITSIGMLTFLAGATWISKIIYSSINQQDIFNHQNETFPQQEDYLTNEYSINLPATYRLKNKWRKSWINIINPFRGILVQGTPGSGKSYFIIRHIISQQIQKGFSMFIYDFKFDDLSTIAYNHHLQYKRTHGGAITFYSINFDDLSRSHRCNPLDPVTMIDITDAAESARTILLGLNREWIKRQGDFFVESPINFLTAIIWYLRCYREGEFCTLPHVIELLQLDYDTLFSILRVENEIDVLINPFITAYLNDAMEQLEGQIARQKLLWRGFLRPNFIMCYRETILP
ncbi:YWFCY domain-containing protein [Sphingobacteruim zhuxiongii]|uniref:YWFCY domain-containing protein n=1 Tax=Sphingobacterium zhuxiongii TaxID=2662364 RepID=UPI00293BD653|nr:MULTISPECIES: YWFCY domain-containing protein [unclassified Sphingobacterium]